MEQWSLAEPGQCIWKNSFLSINIGQERLLPSQALDCGPALSDLPVIHIGTCQH